jgi:predicted nucleic acid-binding protein
MRYLYLDASALAKRYAPEPGDVIVHYLFAKLTPDRLVVLKVGIAEVASILLRKRNLGSISPATQAQAMIDFRAEVIDEDQFQKIATTTALVTAALPLIARHSINATDAILLRSALDLAADLRTHGDDLALVASEDRLLRAAQTEGLLVFNPETQTTAELDQLLV